jgi:hypothetical protein
MKDNDLDNSPAYRYWVMAEVVFDRRESKETVVEGRWRKTEHERTLVTWVPILRALSELWNFSDRYGVRMELVFTDGMVLDGPELWTLLDSSAANPFNDYHVVENLEHVVRDLPYRPDLRGVIDLPTRTAYYGGMGLRLEDLR